jgi:hypothetical protein
MDMDGDSNDEVTSEALNGETKPDVAKLAQSILLIYPVIIYISRWSCQYNTIYWNILVKNLSI